MNRGQNLKQIHVFLMLLLPAIKIFRYIEVLALLAKSGENQLCEISLKIGLCCSQIIYSYTEPIGENPWNRGLHQLAPGRTRVPRTPVQLITHTILYALSQPPRLFRIFFKEDLAAPHPATLCGDKVLLFYDQDSILVSGGVVRGSGVCRKEG